MFPRVNYYVTPHQSEVATDHEDVDTYPTSLDLSKNMSGQIVCMMLNIFLLRWCQILHKMMMMTVRQVEILQQF